MIGQVMKLRIPEPKTRWGVLLSWSAAILLTAVARPLVAAPPRQPNIILMLADDVARDWVSCYGASHPTPNLDKLAADGIRFENAWSGPICSVSRVMILTGQYPFRTGWNVHHDATRWGGKGFDPAAFPTVATVLRQAGYATAVAGKWQINDLRPDPDVLKKHGFDEHCMWPGGEAGNLEISDKRYWDAFLQTNGERRTHKGKFGPDVVHEFAKDFIRRHKDKPFFLYYPLISTHGPLEVPPGSTRSLQDVQGVHGDLMTHLDGQVGDLRKFLDELGLTSQTVVIYTGDNGTAVGGTLHGRRVPGAKGRTSDLGLHVPLIITAPMLTRGGVVTTALADFTDLFPTFVELAGAQVPPGLKLDGHSLVPILQGQTSNGREWLFAEYGPRRTIRDQRYKLDKSGALYDLRDDPLEAKDLRNSTDPAVIAARQRLAAVLSSIPPDPAPPFDGFGTNTYAKGPTKGRSRE
jgi:arylsulfatase A-like enzyme